MDWLSTVKKIAPTVASAFLGPLGGVAVAAVGELLGVSDATQEKIAGVIQNGMLTPEQVSKLRELELEYQNNEQERSFKYSDLEFKDVADARNREVQTKDNTNKVLAYGIIGAFLATTGATLLGWTKVDSVMAGTLIGYLSAKAEQVLSYYFGSTKSSARKTEIIAQSEAVK